MYLIAYIIFFLYLQRKQISIYFSYEEIFTPFGISI